MKMRYLTIISSCCLLVFTGCDNNRTNSVDEKNDYDNRTTSGTTYESGTTGLSTGARTIDSDVTPGNMTSTDEYRTTSSTMSGTGNTTSSTSYDKEDVDRDGKFPDKDGDGKILNRDGDGKLFEKDGKKVLRRDKQDRSPDSKNTTTGSSEDLEETTSDRSTH